MRYSRLRPLALLASLTLLTGCNGEPSVVDTAETVRPDPAKPAVEPAKDQPAKPETTK